nr:High-affinity branched-chain amino acid transport ATP-binding protein LivF [Cupriavidus sp.]
MLAISRALMTNPTLLILDEATEGLSPLIRQEIWKALDTLRAEGMSILVIDKNINPLLRLCDWHTIVEKGHRVWEGDSQSLAADQALHRRYLGA